MKKSILVALVAVLCTMSACADNDQLITFAQLPAPAQATVKQYFDEANVAFCTYDANGDRNATVTASVKTGDKLTLKLEVPEGLVNPD